jgi:hypothetical protein
MPRQRLIHLLVRILIVGSGHVVVVLLLGLLLKRDSPAPFDLGIVVLMVPAFIAVALYAYLLRPYVVEELPSAPPIVATISLAIVPAIISFSVSLFVFVNVFGS